MSRTILANVDGFTPVIDGLVEELGLMSAVVFGRVWRYCQMEDRVCKASLESIGDSIGVDRVTVMRHIKELCERGYLQDLTPDLRNRPHVYVDTGKAGLTLSLTGVAQSNTKEKGVAQINSGVAERNVTVAESHLNRVFKKDSKREKAAALDFKNMTVADAHQVPTLKMYADATGWFPADVLWKTVHDTITEKALTFEQLHSAAAAWVGRGYKRGNVEGILEWAINGIPANGNGSKPATGATPAIDEGAVEATRKLLDEKYASEFAPPPPGLRPNIQIRQLARQKGIRK